MLDLYDSIVEEEMNEKAIVALIEETHLPPDAVRSAYLEEYRRLKHDARVKDFLPVFTMRRAKESLLRS